MDRAVGPGSPTPRSILALNVAAPTRDHARGLLELLWPAEDDLWVLTETSAGPGTTLIADVCRAAGHAVHHTRLADGQGRGVMVVVRTPALAVEVERLPGPAVLPGRVLSVHLTGPGWPALRVLGVYGAASDPVRYSSSTQRERKRQWLAAFADWLPGWRGLGPETSAVLIGDLNIVDPLHDAELRHVLPQESALLERLGQDGWVDAWRADHPDSRDVSWVDHTGAGARYDHAFVTASLATQASCDLDHSPREAGLSDHSALRLVLGTPPTV